MRGVWGERRGRVRGRGGGGKGVGGFERGVMGEGGGKGKVAA